MTITPVAFRGDQAAAYLNLSPKTLAKMRMAGTGPRYAKLHDGPRAGVLYRVSDLDAWVEERLVGDGRR
ncbi:helix-turn-helix domain-containing protein [Brachybacterium sp. NPDC056505]|uniref:helix-turn-helix domain-containing protein n=1 Tax=Brachybacterium sp. NPDC056505 TaxID=3345843 RepID=UPI003672FFDB